MHLPYSFYYDYSLVYSYFIVIFNFYLIFSFGFLFLLANGGVVRSVDITRAVLCHIGYRSRALQEWQERVEEVSIVLLLRRLSIRFMGAHRRHHGTPEEGVPHEWDRPSKKKQERRG